MIRQLSDEVVQRLKERAKRNNRSLEQELREILTVAGLDPYEEMAKLRTAFGARSFSDSSDLIRER